MLCLLPASKACRICSPAPAPTPTPAPCRYASVFQMLRGTLVIFAGLLTILLLKRRLHSHHWLGMVRRWLGLGGCTPVGAGVGNQAPCLSGRRQDTRATPKLLHPRCKWTYSPASLLFHWPQVLICAGAALVGASSVIYDRSGTQAPQQLALNAGAGGDGSIGGSTGAAGLRRLLLLEPGPGRWRGDGGGGTAPDPLLGNVLVVLAQVGGGRSAVAAAEDAQIICCMPTTATLGWPPNLPCVLAPLWSAAAGRISVHWCVSLQLHALMERVGQGVFCSFHKAKQTATRRLRGGPAQPSLASSHPPRTASWPLPQLRRSTW